MSLPDITEYIPKIELPFDIPILAHPIVVHFMIAIPVIVLLLELTNLIIKKKAVGVVSFVLLLLTVIAAAAAYLTGLVDGKEAFDVLTQVGKTELAEHKLLGTYLLLVSVVVLFFKLLSAAISSGMMKSFYILLLVAFVLGIFNQGQDGGELVYEHGMNVAPVKTMDDKIFDLEEALEEAQEKIAQSQKTLEETVTPKVPESTPEIIEETTHEETAPVKIEAQEKIVQSQETVEETVVPKAPETTSEEIAPVKTIGDTTEVTQEASLPYPEPVQVERIPEAIPQVQIPTH